MSDGDRLRELAAEVSAIGVSRECLGNELVPMAAVDLSAALVELAAWCDRDDDGCVQEFAADARTAPARLITRPGVGT